MKVVTDRHPVWGKVPGWNADGLPDLIDPPAVAQRVVQTPSRPSAQTTINLIAEMKGCPHWVARSDCGCGVNVCRAGKGKAGLVSHADCQVCLREK